LFNSTNKCIYIDGIFNKHITYFYLSIFWITLFCKINNIKTKMPTLTY